MTRARTKTERLARERLVPNLIRIESDGWIDATLREQIPDAWHTLEADVDVREPKEKVTLYLDRSVARFYRGMGHGYHARINRLLATWAQMKIAGEVRLDAYLQKRLREMGDDHPDAPEGSG
ncbi:BrnA antitoxin of type II toxin-antitoxin system [Salinihabitans flavidus]|uniref:BrnA antitoxin of type II toxin-antitoxin system n=1 Tax=Salinihabitans flavidus TaxID=569882 RepID=A0A1H8SU68_9RHOB|nr:BrnA antitoxin family protein [Salinihabitans flavidus]SEO81908.1 BrnA antitoxin of type II toxin-antitoxin system [Salinihabitans flavidus]